MRAAGQFVFQPICLSSISARTILFLNAEQVLTSVIHSVSHRIHSKLRFFSRIYTWNIQTVISPLLKCWNLDPDLSSVYLCLGTDRRAHTALAAVGAPPHRPRIKRGADGLGGEWRRERGAAGVGRRCRRAIESFFFFWATARERVDGGGRETEAVRW